MRRQERPNPLGQRLGERPKTASKVKKPRITDSYIPALKNNDLFNRLNPSENSSSTRAVKKQSVRQSIKEELMSDDEIEDDLIPNPLFSRLDNHKKVDPNVTNRNPLSRALAVTPDTDQQSYKTDSYHSRKVSNEREPIDFHKYGKPADINSKYKQIVKEEPIDFYKYGNPNPASSYKHPQKNDPEQVSSYKFEKPPNSKFKEETSGPSYNNQQPTNSKYKYKEQPTDSYKSAKPKIVRADFSQYRESKSSTEPINFHKYGKQMIISRELVHEEEYGQPIDFYKYSKEHQSTKLDDADSGQYYEPASVDFSMDVSHYFKSNHTVNQTQANINQYSKSNQLSTQNKEPIDFYKYSKEHNAKQNQEPDKYEHKNTNGSEDQSNKKSQKSREIISFKSFTRPSVTIIKNLPLNMTVTDLEQVLIMNQLGPIKLIKIGQQDIGDNLYKTKCFRAEILYHNPKNNLNTFEQFNNKYLIDNKQILKVSISNGDSNDKLKFITNDELYKHYEEIIKSNNMIKRKFDRLLNKIMDNDTIIKPQEILNWDGPELYSDHYK